MNIVELILSKTLKTETCWLWQGSKRKDGYGQMTVGKRPNRKKLRPHRALYEALYGTIPENLACCHRCDVRLCVNPDHIFLGTREENQKDMARKKRAASGERNGFSKLTDEQVREIKSLLGTKKQKEIAAQFGVYPTVISKISLGKIWRHI